MAKEEVKEEEPKYQLGEVITGKEYVVLAEGKALTNEQVLVLILNKLEEIKSRV